MRGEPAQKTLIWPSPVLKRTYAGIAKGKMFSFHKPKVYRSSKGCCICKAKSSSSRFTDSKKYEEDFIKCFVLEERRTGEICNACVLLVKRWKKLPAGTDRNWNHVVDARAGPGIKSLTKFKSKNKKKKLKDTQEKLEKIVKKKHVYQKRDREESPAMSDDLTEEDFNGSGSKNSSRAASPEESCDTSTEAKMLALALAYFRRDMICCGLVFKGRNGEVMMDGNLMKPWSGSVAKRQQRQMTVLRKSPSPGSASTSPSHSSAATSPAHSMESAVETTVSKPATNHRFYESSSDSGYDESSNQGIGESKLAKIIQNSASGIKIEPLKSVQLKAVPIAEAVRIKSDVPMKLVPMKPISLVAATNLTLSNLSLNDGTSIPIAQSSGMAIPSNPLVDFAIHASSRQPVTN